MPLGALGLLASFATAGYLTASFLSGRILRVLPIGSMLALSTLAAALALLGFALTSYWPVLLAFSFIAGLGGGAIDAGLNAYGAVHFSARTLNWLHASWGLGTTMGPLIVTGVLTSGNVWRWSYVIVGGTQLLLALTFFFTRQRWVDGVKASEAHTPPVPAARTRDTLRRPVVWLGMLTCFLYGGVEVATAQWSYSLLTLGRAVPETTAGLYVSLYWGSLMAGRILFGVVAHRVSLVSTLRWCLIASVAGAVLFWLEPTQWLSTAGLMMLGLFFAPIFASLISLTPMRVGAAHANSAIGFQIAAGGLGGAALTALIGVITRWAGLEAIGFSIVIAAVLLLAVYEGLTRAGRQEPVLETVPG
ncbi:MFS transporter [Deinococcus malanensis]|uniref:MFS transporter n=1 Tax=Deinococcus malanensis TaxID=1706855 RepID=A0ABQ2EZG9_9DEIO|nr:MFS transporter [Deinococcus malanensis]